MVEKWVAVLFAVFFGVGVAIGALWSASETADKIIGLPDDQSGFPIDQSRFLLTIKSGNGSRLYLGPAFLVLR